MSDQTGTTENTQSALKSDRIAVKSVDRSRDNRIGIETTSNGWFGCWNKDLWDEFQPGAVLSIAYTVSADGKYKNVKSITSSLPQPNRAVPATSGEADRNQRIARQVALKAAVEYANNRPADFNGIDAVLKLGEIFYGWLEAPDNLPF